MPKASYLIALLGFAFILVGCPGGDDDDDVSGDDDDIVWDCMGEYDVESPSDYPVVQQCESISGTLRFYELDWLTSIEMPDLTTVGEDLIIADNDALTNLDGLSSLITVGGWLVIYGNDVLTSLDGLSGLTTVGGSLDIHANRCLSPDEAEAFAASLVISGDVEVYDNGWDEDYPCD